MRRTSAMDFQFGPEALYDQADGDYPDFGGWSAEDLSDGDLPDDGYLSDLVDDLVGFEDTYDDLGEALFDDDWYDDLSDAEAIYDALESVLAEDAGDALLDAEAILDELSESMSSAEFLNFGQALKQIERGASRALADPTFGQIVRTAAPIAGGAAGTVIGGPAGTAIGTAIGSAAARSIPTQPTPRPPTPRQPIPVVRTAPPRRVVGAVQPGGVGPSAGAGSRAALQSLVLSQQPDVLRSLLSVALGSKTQRTSTGVPVGAVLSMLSTMLGHAAADADAMFEAVGFDGEAVDAGLAPAERAQMLYEDLIDAENASLTDGW